MIEPLRVLLHLLDVRFICIVLAFIIFAFTCDTIFRQLLLYKCQISAVYQSLCACFTACLLINTVHTIYKQNWRLYTNKIGGYIQTKLECLLVMSKLKLLTELVEKYTLKLR